MELVPLPDSLKAVPRPAIEDYVLGRIRQFSQVFAHLVCPGVPNHEIESAFVQAVSVVSGANQSQEIESYSLRFTHKCKFLGCQDKSCTLCANNPNKKCLDHDNFDECYADNQSLKSKCDVDVYVQLVSQTTGNPVNVPGVEIQVCVVDGESCSHNTGTADAAKELLRSDDGHILLGSMSSASKNDGAGRMLLKLQDGVCRLPDLFITDKNDTFHMETRTFSSFRMVARAIQRDLYGNVMLLDTINPAVSAKLIVKTQRALNDYRKSEYPHYKDELTKLKFIGSITAQRLRDIQAHVPDAPFISIETVHQLKDLILFADQNRQLENKLLELLNMRGRHKHKWDFLREILSERIVYDDMLHRIWFSDEMQTRGLLFTCKQGQVNLDKPLGMAYRTMQPDGTTKFKVVSAQDSQASQNVEVIRDWKAQAEEAWATEGHRGWVIVNEPLELASSSNVLSPRQSVADGMNGVQVFKRESQPMLSPRPSEGISDGSMSSLSRSQPSFADAGRAAAYPVHSASMQAASNFPDQKQQQQQQQPTISNPFQVLALSNSGSGPIPGLGGSNVQSPYKFGGRSSHNNKDAAAAALALGMPDQATRTSAPSTYMSHNIFSTFSPASGSSAPIMSFDPSTLLGWGADGSGLGGPSHSDKPTPFRRMSAEHILPRQPMVPAAGGRFNIALDLSSKRQRAPLQVQADQVLVQQEVSGGHNAKMQDVPIRPISGQAVYHQESRGRHHPRCRVSEADVAMENSGAGLEESIDDFLAQALPSLLPVNYSHVFNRDRDGSGYMMGASHEHLHTPTHHLSNTLEQSLRLGQDTGSGGAGGTHPHAAGFYQADNDSFNKNLSRILKHSESDSFKHLLEASGLSSPRQLSEL